MKDFYVGIIIFAAVLWLIGLFTAAVIGFQKSLKSPPQINKIEIQRLRAEQEQRTDDIQRRYKLLREDYKQKIRDSRKKF